MANGKPKYRKAKKTLKNLKERLIQVSILKIAKSKKKKVSLRI